MFQSINRIKDRKGFTLVELMTTVFLLGIVGVLFSQLFMSMYHKYQQVENKYLIQSEVRFIVQSFQNDADNRSLYTATQADVFYEDLAQVKTNNKYACLDDGAGGNFLGTFTVSSDGNQLTFQKNSGKYTYILSYDGYLFVLPANSTVANRFHLADDVKLDTYFTVSTAATALTYDSTNMKDVEANPTRFIDRGVTITVTGKLPDPYGIREFQEYSINTSLAFINMTDNVINMNNADGTHLTNTYVAGYYTKANNSSTLTNYPSTSAFISGNPTSYPNLNKVGNIIRYISAEDAWTPDAGSGADQSNSLSFNCIARWLMMNSDMGLGVIGTLRDFRDNVLRGNAVGEFIIDKYYKYSPTMINFLQNNEALANVARSALTNVAILIEMSK